MKKLKLVCLYFLAGALTFVSCTKEEDPAVDPGTNSATPVMNATVDGKAWTANVMGGSQQNGMTNITGQTTAGEMISITLNGVSEGNYTLSQSTNHVGVYSPSAGALAYTSHANSTGGTVTISKIDATNKTLTGTFSFTATEPSSGKSVVVSSGVFNKITYTTQTTTVNKKMSAKVDGSAWQAQSVFGSGNMGKIMVTGNSSNGSTIGITVKDNITTGTYTLSTFGDYVGQYNMNSSTYLSSKSGTLIITEHDVTNRIIKGTFDFEATQFGGGSAAASITEGSFETKY